VPRRDGGRDGTPPGRDYVLQALLQHSAEELAAVGVRVSEGGT
jgi:hypothetical protein